MMKFVKRLAHVDDTLKVFGIEPEYAVSRRENIMTAVLWIIVTFCQGVMDFILTLLVYKPAYIGVLKCLIFDIPIHSASLLELTFAMKIS